MTESTVVIRVDRELKDAFADAAKSADRTASQLLRDFMRDFVQERTQSAEYDAWFRRKVEAGLKAAAEGRLKTSDEVERYFAKRRADTLRKLARTNR